MNVRSKNRKEEASLLTSSYFPPPKRKNTNSAIMCTQTKEASLLTSSDPIPPPKKNKNQQRQRAADPVRGRVHRRGARADHHGAALQAAAGPAGGGGAGTAALPLCRGGWVRVAWSCRLNLDGSGLVGWMTAASSPTRTNPHPNPLYISLPHCYFISGAGRHHRSHQLMYPQRRPPTHSTPQPSINPIRCRSPPSVPPL